jgi:hypothetical protein
MFTPGVVGGGVARTQQLGGFLTGVVAHRYEHVVPVGPLAGAAGSGLLGWGQDQGAVGVDHRPSGQFHPVHDHLGKAFGPLGQDLPHVAAHRGAGALDPAQGRLVDLLQCPPHGGEGGDGSDDGALVLQQADVADARRAQGDGHRQVDQDLAPIVQRMKAPPPQGIRQHAGQPGPLSQQPQMYTADVPDLPLAVGGHGKPAAPLAILHVKGAFQPAPIRPSASRIQAGQKAPLLVVSRLVSRAPASVIHPGM